MRVILTIALILFSQLLFAHAAHFDEAYCQQAAAKMEVVNISENINQLTQLLVDMKFGKHDEALIKAEKWILTNINMAKEHLEENPCSLTDNDLAALYPMLRVIAAINEVSPINSINNNNEILKLMKEAIKKDNKNYQQLLERIKNRNGNQ